ncbi:IniB N-terminal domain-containing protein, partial [Pseudonocardia hispaniensis]
MAALTDLIDFLLKLMRDPEARAQFDQNPEQTLQQHDLAGVSGDDVRDARLLLADRGDVRATSDAAPPPRGGGDPVREIQHTTTAYEPVREYVVNQHTEQITNITNNIDDRDTIIDDRDVTNIDDRDIDIDIDDRDVDVDIDKSDDDITVVKDSFNQDNDTEVTAINESFNEDTEVTAINESFNEDTEVTAIN